MKTESEQRKAAAEFADFWKDKGDEKQESQRFWIGLLGDVFGIVSPANYIEFEKRVKLSHTSYIDAYIADTKVLIEQKGAKIDLHKSYEQSDGAVLTPFEQAKRYVSEMKASEKPRWIVVCNFAEFLVYDLETPEAEAEQIFLKDLGKEYYRLQFLIDEKNENIRREEALSIEAGKLVDKLYSAILPQYKELNEKSLRSLNILCVRIVFCLYAEDAGLFATRTAFEDYLKSFNLPNVRKGLIELFKALDTKEAERDQYDETLKPFPYVNGGLFKDENIEIPNFTKEIIDVIVKECAPFNWSEISPTIFGAVFESTLNPETRRKGGMHYTSIQNIHKVIDPLFLDDLEKELETICDTKQAKAKTDKLLKFQEKLGSLKFLDPACGSGNFLTETYLSLRRLENRVISILNNGETVLGFDEFIKVHINQFFGIEINDFAVTVAKTALWIAESQMIAETEAILSQNIDFLPLTTNAFIVEGNALRTDWKTLKPQDGNNDIGGLFAGFTTQVDGTAHEYNYIMGNPPFVGKKEQSKNQKEELVALFPKTVKGVGNLDYVTGWYAKAIELIKNTNTKCAFVSTNSITQGEQVPTLWKYLSEQGLEIDYSWRTFRWDSESTEKAHVHCVIIGFSHNSSSPKKAKIIFDEGGNKNLANHINGYLIDATDVFIENRAKALCNVPKIVYGSMPIDDNHLILSKEEADAVITENPSNEKFIRKYVGGDELLNNGERFCLWLKDASVKELRQSKLISARVQETKDFRSKSSRPQTLKLADTPWLFGEIRQPESPMLAIPKVSSERREYIPIAFVSPEIILNGSTLIVPDATLYEFGVLMSNVHNDWMRVVAGRLETRYQYSGNIVYNNFPWCNPTDEQRFAIEKSAQAILDARANHFSDTLADLYDETFMPADLRKAHRENDKAVMAAYGFKNDMTEADIVGELFKMYEDLTKAQ
ncbi:DNA methyltransferase [Treponema saccharophilum]|uniref:site-specific DNA-methyltransferase (adenine-specific) n=1 Tax=Treponema saccharophilum DSM 2985 TaxID=907348 RepID=H7EJY7_9SPIR|nr:DNA methyltransferase [Treponema saccharophilum]EIC02074.1 hypothetical protein TresaDRAFT_1410 [Treponema saccharophilum DSM 2985]BDC96264.1 methylase [Treponema saccharophilum]